MKKHHRLFTLFSALLLAFAALSSTALAAEAESAAPFLSGNASHRETYFFAE